MLPRRRRHGTVGPVQVLVLGIDEPRADGMLAAEVQDLETQGAVRVLEVLRVRRGSDGEISRLAPPPGAEDDPVGLIEGLRVLEEAGEEGADDDPPSEAGAGEGRADADAWFLAERIPPGSAAAILLVEHRWAIPLREAAAESGATICADAWVHPGDLATVRAGLREGRRPNRFP